MQNHENSENDPRDPFQAKDGIDFRIDDDKNATLRTKEAME